MPRPPLPTVGGNNRVWGTMNNAALTDLRDEMDTAITGAEATAVQANVSLALNRTDGADAYSDFRQAPDGIPVSLDSGQPWHHVAGDSDHQMRVVDGVLTNAKTTGLSAGHAEVDLGAPVQRIGATVTFGSYSTNNGSAALVIWTTQHDTGEPIPYSPLHLSVTPVQMALALWETDPPGGGIDYLDTYNFPTALTADGTTEYKIEARIRDTQIECWVSDAATGVVVGEIVASDSRVADYAGPWATWETYASDASTDSKASFVEVWAGTAAETGRARGESPDAIRAVVQSRVANVLPIVRSVSPELDESMVVGESAGEIHAGLRLPVVFPKSGALIVTVSLYVVASSSWVILKTSWDSSISSEAYAQTIVNGSCAQQIMTSFPLTNTPGATGTLHFGAFRVGGSAGITLYNLTGYKAFVSAVAGTF